MSGNHECLWKSLAHSMRYIEISLDKCRSTGGAGKINVSIISWGFAFWFIVIHQIVIDYRDISVTVILLPSMTKKSARGNKSAFTHYTTGSKTSSSVQYILLVILCVFSVFYFLSCRMRERGPCICGVGLWSLLLSLCLASLTHAHRSHTGR